MIIVDIYIDRQFYENYDTVLDVSQEKVCCEREVNPCIWNGILIDKDEASMVMLSNILYNIFKLSFINYVNLSRWHRIGWVK